MLKRFGTTWKQMNKLSTTMSLKDTIQSKWKYCIENKQIFFINSQATVMEDHSIPFVIRYLDNDDLKMKKSNLKCKSSFVDPFCLEYRRNEGCCLVVKEYKDYALIFNKFSVLNHHMLLVPNIAYPQTDPLTLNDFKQICEVINDIQSLVFYNCGIQSGASQPHKHMQIIPMDSFDGCQLPVDPLINSCLHELNLASSKSLFTLSTYQFKHNIIQIQKDSNNQYIPNQLYNDYLSLLMSFNLKTKPTNTIISDHLVDTNESYNFILTPQYMMLIPRRCESYNTVNINSLGFIGSLVVNTEKNSNELNTEGPLTILKNVSFPIESK